MWPCAEGGGDTLRRLRPRQVLVAMVYTFPSNVSQTPYENDETEIGIGYRSSLIASNLKISKLFAVVSLLTPVSSISYLNYVHLNVYRYHANSF